jgi:hypothetical protein
MDPHIDTVFLGDVLSYAQRCSYILTEYGHFQGWTMSEHMEKALRVWERKILRRLYGLKWDTNGWKIRTNK